MSLSLCLCRHTRCSVVHADAWLKVSANALLMPKDPAVLLPKPLKHAVWNALIPHPVANVKGAIAVKWIVAYQPARVFKRRFLTSVSWCFYTLSDCLRGSALQRLSACCTLCCLSRTKIQLWAATNQWRDNYQRIHDYEQPFRTQESVFKDMCPQENKTRDSSAIALNNAHKCTRRAVLLKVSERSHVWQNSC